jgi:hypothetical protein
MFAATVCYHGGHWRPFRAVANCLGYEGLTALAID